MLGAPPWEGSNTTHNMSGGGHTSQRRGKTGNETTYLDFGAKAFKHCYLERLRSVKNKENPGGVEGGVSPVMDETEGHLLVATAAC